jgi:hypothetical protein
VSVRSDIGEHFAFNLRMRTSVYFFSLALTFAQRALCAAAILFLDASETCRLGTPARPVELCFAHRAFCARLILFRAEADIFRRVLGLIEFEPIPDKAETAASSRPNSNAALSLAAFNCASISMYPPRAGIVAND